ncbi:hypothetical protein MUY27_15905 [Mucilaginibacter sp. RS28]|uniref:DUF3592 domain-containing protein n=1 Tax=Mucilaginibacter straminoryzae TaxID=2932774 RepID=A0A9X2BEA4_9SPHI|nr:hypothetical protein [Mucilaginibacter straminoryzae]MCJ8211203.1 hypothetical protein [Mucilaginibacter straminoryzae]
MNVQRKQLLSPFFIFALIILIPSLVLGIHNGKKLWNIYISSPDRYEFTKAKLLRNYHGKYNNHATYQFRYKGKILEGSAGSILWGAVGEEVTIYFEKNNIENNGILSGLFFLAVGQWLIFLVLGAYIVFKLVHYLR